METNWKWVNASVAAYLALQQDATMELLRKGHGSLGAEQFIRLLDAGEMRLIIFKNKSIALVSFGECEHGKFLNILTVQGTMHTCEESMGFLEEAAKEAGAKLIVSVGHRGWTDVMLRHGYEVEPRILMRKFL